ncbi:hypothetical protein [Mesorhizobium sp. CN2-181]|uniref:hypothetical protein n=1 Tax=Mesorhizobium yinganensis TaxID=3157707 RepID=UPI0032B77202
MPQVLGLVGLLGSLVTTAVSGLGAPAGPLTVETSNMTRHRWPYPATTRRTLFDAVFGGTAGFENMAAMRAILEAAADRPQAELDAAAAAALAAGNPIPAYDREWPITGRCIARVIGEDVAKVIVDPDAPIRAGDVVFYAVRGTPALMGKVFAGRKGNTVSVWASEPDLLIHYDAGHILHMERVIAIEDGAGKWWPLSPVSFPALKNFDAFEPPRLRNLQFALGMVLADIVETARTLPGEPAHRPLFRAA